MSSTDRLIVIPDLTAQEQGLLDELLVQWRSKRKRNNLRAGFYDMKNAQRNLMSSNAPAEVKRRKYVLGLSATAVDKLNRRCNADGFFDASGANLADLGMDDLERENRLRSELSQAGISSLIHAVSWLVTVQGDTAAGEPDVLILPRDASTATGMWDPRRRGLRSFLSITETDDRGEPIAMTMYLYGLNVIMTKAARWTVERREHDYGLPVDPMRYKPRLGRPFGSSRISRTVMSLHEQALGVMIRADVNGIAYSLPRYALLGATEQAFQNADGSPKPTWQAAWDAIWAIGDDEDLANSAAPNLARADIKQFHGQSPEPQNSHLRMLLQMFSGETGVPIGELGLIGDANPTSAEALSVAKDDLIAEAEQTTDGWDPDISASLTRALRMKNGGDVPADLDVRTIWRNHMYVSRSVAADAGAKVLADHPELRGTEVGMEISGLSSQQITRAKVEIRANRGRALLSRLPAPEPEPASGDVV